MTDGEAGRIGRRVGRMAEALGRPQDDRELVDDAVIDAPGPRHDARHHVVEVGVVVDPGDPGGIGWARVGEDRQGQPHGQDEQSERVAHGSLGPGRLHELAHLLAQLPEALLGLRDARELLGREHGPDLQGRARAVLGELIA